MSEEKEQSKKEEEKKEKERKEEPVPADDEENDPLGPGHDLFTGWSRQCTCTCTIFNCYVKAMNVAKDCWCECYVPATLLVVALCLVVYLGVPLYGGRYTVWDDKTLSRTHYLPDKLVYVCHDDGSRDSENRAACAQLVSELYCHSVPYERPGVESICRGNGMCEPTQESALRLARWRAAVEMCAPPGKTYETQEAREALREHHRAAAWQLVYKILAPTTRNARIVSTIADLGIERTFWQVAATDADTAPQLDEKDARINALEQTIERLDGEIQHLRMIQEEVIQEQSNLRQTRPSTKGYTVVPNAGGLNAIIDLPVDTAKKQRLDPTLLVH